MRKQIRYQSAPAANESFDNVVVFVAVVIMVVKSPLFRGVASLFMQCPAARQDIRDRNLVVPYSLFRLSHRPTCTPT